jgi:acetolactate synthase I/II/III large subunit
MPGGGSNADLVEAAGAAGLPFSLAHTETASAFMASAQAEITGRPGACIATLGPGAASLVNGVANAYLDRVPLLVLTDCRTRDAAPIMQHQTLAHGEILGPVIKWSAQPRAGELESALQQALDALASLPPGPVHLDLSSDVTGAAAASNDDFSPPGRAANPTRQTPVPAHVEQILQRSRRPVIVAGLGSRTPAIADAVRAACSTVGMPGLVTYKAKGVLPDRHAWFGGVLTNGALERPILERADAIIAVGLDPVELLPQPWTSDRPVIAITPWPMVQRQIPIEAELVGDVAGLLGSVATILSTPTQWTLAELRQLVNAQRDQMRPCGDAGDLMPHRVVEVAAELYAGARATVDAGAHMFPVAALWPTEQPCGLLISNGLSTMGFALPAAIGASLLDPTRPVLAFTGDAGLLMCLAELRTAARENVPVRVIVFDDGALSLIKIKQIERGYRTDGVAIGPVDWPALGRGCGVRAYAVETEEALGGRLRETADYPGPVLIAAKVAAATYRDTMRALRG